MCDVNKFEQCNKDFEVDKLSGNLWHRMRVACVSISIGAALELRLHMPYCTVAEQPLSNKENSSVLISINEQSINKHLKFVQYWI